MTSTPVPRTMTGLVASTYHTQINRWNSPDNWTRLPPRPAPEKFPYKGGTNRGIRLPKNNKKKKSVGGHIKGNIPCRENKQKKKVRADTRLKSNTQGEIFRNKVHTKKMQQKWDTYCVDAQNHRYGYKQTQGGKKRSAESSLSYIRQSAHRRMVLKELQKRLDFEIIEEKHNEVDQDDNDNDGTSSCDLMDKHASTLVGEIRQMKESISCMFIGQKDELLSVQPPLRSCNSINQNTTSTAKGPTISKLTSTADMQLLTSKPSPSTDEGGLYKSSNDKTLCDIVDEQAAEMGALGKSDDVSACSFLTQNQRLRIHEKAKEYLAKEDIKLLTQYDIGLVQTRSMISIKNNLQSDDGALLEINQSLIPANILSYSDYPTERNMMKLEENIKCEETCGGEDKSPDNGSELSDNASLWTCLSYNQRTRIRSRREDIQSKGDGGTYMNNNANENACTTTYGCNETNTLNTNWKSNGLITEESSNTHVPINSDHNVPLNVNDEDNKIREDIVTGMLNNIDNEKIDSLLM